MIWVIDAELTHLAYAPKIAGTMLHRRQAEAVVVARANAVQGAVGTVALALTRPGGRPGARPVPLRRPRE